MLINTQRIRNFIREEIDRPDIQDPIWQDLSVTAGKVSAICAKCEWNKPYSCLWNSLSAIKYFFQTRVVRYILADELRISQTEEGGLRLLKAVSQQVIDNILQGKASADSLLSAPRYSDPRITQLNPRDIQLRIQDFWQWELDTERGAPFRDMQNVLWFFQTLDRNNVEAMNQAACLFELYKKELSNQIDPALQVTLREIYARTDGALFGSFFHGDHYKHKGWERTWNLSAYEREQIHEAEQAARAQIRRDFIERVSYASIQVQNSQMEPVAGAFNATLKPYSNSVLTQTEWETFREDALMKNVFQPILLKCPLTDSDREFWTLYRTFLDQRVATPAFDLWFNGVGQWLPLEFNDLWKISSQETKVQIIVTIESETRLRFRYVVNYDVVPFLAKTYPDDPRYTGSKIPVTCEYEATLSYGSLDAIDVQQWNGSKPVLYKATIGNSVANLNVNGISSSATVE